MTTTRTEADAIIQALSDQREPTIKDVEIDGIKATVIFQPQPGGSWSVISAHGLAGAFRKAPERRKGIAVMGDLASFINHTNRFRDADSAIFASADPEDLSLTTVFDYHCATSDGAPRFGEHRCVYKFPISDEWEAWNGAHGKSMSQQEFAEFIETRIVDVVETTDLGTVARKFSEKLGGIEFASPRRLLELSRGLQLRIGANVKQALNLSTGEVQMIYETQHQDERGEPLKVPTAFCIAIPVFEAGVLYQVPVRLRYRESRGVISWRVELHGAEVMVGDAFQEAKDLASKETALPLFVGAPEA